MIRIAALFICVVMSGSMFRVASFGALSGGGDGPEDSSEEDGSMTARDEKRRIVMLVQH